MWRLIAAVLAAGLIALLGVVGVRAWRYAAPPPAFDAEAPDLKTFAVDMDAATGRLSEAIRFRTVSLSGLPTDDPTQFEQFHQWLFANYPAFHAAARVELINSHSLLYTWQGTDSAQPPILLLAHQDVVPVPEDTVERWSVDPFGGIIKDAAVWGRGAIDDKSSLIGILEAAEVLAASGRQPARTIIFAFGHDEELGGERGATAMAAALRARGIRAWFALDEGLAVLAEHPLTGKPAALIGISEKGAGTLRVTATAEPGHSSMPPHETAVSTLARAVTAIHTMPIERSLAGGPADDMMRALAPDMSVGTRVALANEWLFAPLLQSELAGDRAAQALLGTTVAPTMIDGGIRPNVLPGEAVAYINLRIHPRDTSADLLDRARAALAEFENVEVEWAETPNEASPVSSARSSSYALIAAMSRAATPNAPVAPGLVVAGTDSRLYAEVAENVYRYQPIVLLREDYEAIHGVNERLSIENFERVIRFYAGLMEAGAMP